ncbi:MAG: cation:proton antiporter [bacterium]|nr:cation:proton antiporter [bacterium]
MNFIPFGTKRSLRAGLLAALTLFAPIVSFAAEEASSAAAGGHHGVGQTFFWIAIILTVAGIAKMIERKGQPAVLGEILVGVVLGNLALLGIHWFEPMKTDAALKFLAELGVGILLFQIGLESTVGKMRKVGKTAFIVAIAGVVVPFALGYFGSLWLIEGISSYAAIFIGATLTATSVGITARVLKDLGKLQTKESQVILGAAVIDDVLGLIILAVVSALVTTGSVSAGAVSWIIVKAVLFLGGALWAGQLAAPHLSRTFSTIHTGHAMKLITAVVFFLVFAFLAEVVGLAPIVGAFAGGLVLESVHFKGFKDPDLVTDAEEFHETLEKNLDPDLHSTVHETYNSFSEKLTHARDRHVEELVETLGFIFTPIFFVMTGMSVDLATLGNLPILGIALMLTAVAFVGKLVCGLVAEKGMDRWIVGFGMAPRGEVGLIFANIGLALGVVTTSLFSAVVIVVMLTTLMTPPILAMLLRRQRA